MKILFVSRAFPPTIGGIEQQNADLARFLGDRCELTLIANRRGKSFLPVFLPWALFRVLWLLPRHDILLLGDGVLAPIGFIAKCFNSKKAIVSVLHGLDLTFARKSGWLAHVYARLNLPALRSLTGAICVSQETKRVALSVGLSAERCFVVPNGIDTDAFVVRHEHTRAALETLLGKDIAGRQIILRLGRFVEHKGVEWFIRNVVPKLPASVLFVAAGGVAKKGVPGDMSFFPRCEQAVRELGLQDRVILLTNLPGKDVQLLLHTADVAVAPNIPVPGTMEGFGISVLEASISRLPIVVSRLEGLQEAVVDGENGVFAEAGNAVDFVQKINTFLTDEQKRQAFGERSARYTREHFHWSIISQRYAALLEDFMKSVTNTH
ncbi:MAG: glycosyltransferase family 4 protein [Candidatus Moraniibacteriota bacterium]